MFQKLFKPSSLRGLTKMGVSSLRHGMTKQFVPALSAASQNTFMMSKKSSAFSFSSKPKIS